MKGDGRFFTSPDGKVAGSPDKRTATLSAFRIDETLKFGYGVQFTALDQDWVKLQPVMDTGFRSFRITFGNAYTGSQGKVACRLMR